MQKEQPNHPDNPAEQDDERGPPVHTDDGPGGDPPPKPK